jgi:putative endonuclease
MDKMLSGKANNTTDGARAEAQAAAFLASRGLRVEARNFRVRGGEIDLVCRDGAMLVFVEVRLRRSSEFGGAAASITASKQRRLILAARHYLARMPEVPCRFDCVLLSGLGDTDSGIEAKIEWIRDAFSADAGA